VHFDILRAVAAFAVVVIHVSALVVQSLIGNSFNWWTADFFHASVMWAVPVFVMISGALLLDPKRDYTTRGFLARRASRVLAPLVFWSAFYLALRIMHGDLSLERGLVLLLFGRPYSHMWYLYMIVGLYLITPVLRVFLAAAKPQEVKYAVYMAFALGIIYSHLFLLLELGIPLAVIIFVPFISYYLAGYALKTARPGKTGSAALAALFGASIVVTAAGTGWMRLHMPGFHAWKILCYQLSPTVIAMSISIFVLFSRLEDANGKMMKGLIRVCEFIAPYSLGIYIIHPLAMIALQALLGMNGLFLGALVGIPLTSLIVFIVSLTACRVIALVPYLRTVIGLSARD